MNLLVTIGSARFKNPVTVASGTFGYIEEHSSLSDIRKFGAIIPKTITLHAREGNPSPRIVETPSGMLNAIGIENAGVDAFIRNILPTYKKTGVPVIISFLGHSAEEFIAIAERLNDAGGIAAYELNLSCPNLQKKMLVAQDPNLTAHVVAAVKRIARVPVFAKLSPNVTDIAPIARAAQDAGADAVSLVNTLSGMVIDTQKRRPVLGNISGGLSGPAIRPIALYMVYKTAQVVQIPIIAMGGIMTADDALQFIMAGATMVAVGTASFVDPQSGKKILDGIQQYMKKNKMHTLKELRGSAQGA